MTEKMIKYNETGFWIKKAGEEYIIGLSEKGQDDLGEVGFIDLPQTGDITTEDILIDVEAAKAVTELSSPLKGTITEVHEELANEPTLLNSEKEADNWIVKMTGVNEKDFSALADESGLEE